MKTNHKKQLDQLACLAIFPVGITIYLLATRLWQGSVLPQNINEAVNIAVLCIIIIHTTELGKSIFAVLRGKSNPSPVMTALALFSTSELGLIIISSARSMPPIHGYYPMQYTLAITSIIGLGATAYLLVMPHKHATTYRKRKNREEERHGNRSA